MLFEHVPFPRIELEDYIEEGKRFYKCPNGSDYESVTTIISQYLEKTGGHDYLHEWREKVGQEKADEITKIAAKKGAIIHNICEQYVSNNKYWKKGVMPYHMENFIPIKKELDKHLGVVYSTEYPLWSERLKTAGRSDLIGQWDKKTSIIDYKGSRKIKSEDQILGYFIQSTCYAIMCNEMLKTNIKQIVILISVENEYDAQVFIKNVADYKDLVEEVYLNRS